MLTFFKLITWFGSILVLLPCALVIGLALLRMQRLSDAALLVGGLGGSSILAHLLKLVFARPRPQVDEMLVAMPTDFSFPSAHTAQVVAFTLACALALGKDLSGAEIFGFWAVLVIFSALIGYSRIYLQVHYISDVMAGAVVAIAWVSLFSWIIKKIG